MTGFKIPSVRTGGDFYCRNPVIFMSLNGDFLMSLDTRIRKITRWPRITNAVPEELPHHFTNYRTPGDKITAVPARINPFEFVKVFVHELIE
jgi:hypothetical protein